MKCHFLKSKFAKNICIYAIVALFVVSLFPLKASSVIGLSDVAYYNTVVFGNHSAQEGNSEGPLAVLGNFSQDSYKLAYAGLAAFDIIGPDYTDFTYPSLLLGGQYSNAGFGSLVLSGDNVVVSSSVDNSAFEAEIATSYPSVLISQFSASSISSFFNGLNLAVTDLMTNASTFTATTSLPGASLNIGPSTQNARVLVNQGLRTSSTFNASTIDFGNFKIPNMDSYDFLIIYSQATTVTFSSGWISYDGALVDTSEAYAGGMSTMSSFASKTLWIFPNATTVNISSYGVIGSVFAPNADVTLSGGSVSGQLFAKNLDQTNNSLINNFRLDWTTWNGMFTSATPTPSVTATPTPSVTATPTPTSTLTPTPTVTAVSTATATTTSTPTPKATATSSNSIVLAGSLKTKSSTEKVTSPSNVVSTFFSPIPTTNETATYLNTNITNGDSNGIIYIIISITMIAGVGFIIYRKMNLVKK